MCFRALLVSAALALMPTMALAQDSGPDAGVRIPHHRPEVRRASDEPELSLNDSAQAVRRCLSECLDRRADLRDGVCGGGPAPDLSQCFGLGTDACNLAMQAVDMGINVMAAARRRCQEPPPAGAAAPAPAAAVRAAPSEADRQAIRRRREQRADAQCVSGPLQGMCRRCYLDGDRRAWIDGPVAAGIIRMNARRTDMAPPTDAEEYAYRCQNTDVAPLAAIVGRVGVMLEGQDSRLRGVEHDVAEVNLRGAPPSVTTAQALARLARAIQRLGAQRQLDNATRDHRECRMEHRAVTADIDRLDQLCPDTLAYLRSIERQYADLFRETQGEDFVGAGLLIERLNAVAQACTLDPGGATTACLRAHERLSEVAVRPPPPVAPSPRVPNADPSPPAVPAPRVLVRRPVAARSSRQAPAPAPYPLLEGDGDEQP